MTRAEKVEALRAKAASTPYPVEAAECLRLAEKLEARLDDEPKVGDVDLAVDQLLDVLRGTDWGLIKTRTEGDPYHEHAQVTDGD